MLRPRAALEPASSSTTPVPTENDVRDVLNYKTPMHVEMCTGLHSSVFNLGFALPVFRGPLWFDDYFRPAYRHGIVRYAVG